MITNTSNTSRFDNRGKRIGIFVIAYNAESHICETLLRIPEAVWNAVAVIYIIDDCSTDDTVAEALALARDKGKIVVLRNRINHRYGGNQKLGYQYALDEKLDVVAMLHADGQYAPECLESLLAPLVAGEADVVLGSRMIKNGEALKGNMPRYKYCGNIILTRIQNTVCGTTLSEYHSGFRAYSTSLLRRLPLWENTDEWHFDTQILLQATQCGARILEVPIPTYYGNEICHVNGITYALHCVLTSIAFYLHRHGVFYSRKYDLTAHGRPYHDKFDDPYSSHSLILRWLTIAGIKGKQVLDVGVGDASLARKVNKEGGVVDGIEIDRSSAQLARLHCRNVTEVDLDNLNQWQPQTLYDVVLAADVLEHLKSPETALSRLKNCLGPDGLLIVSLPNVANIYVRLNLLLGRFPYHSKGILDRSHLHFYTLESAESLLVRTGWKIAQKDVTVIPLAIVFPFLRRWPFRWLLHSVRFITKLIPSLFSYQSLFLCRNPNKSQLL